MTSSDQLVHQMIWLPRSHTKSIGLRNNMHPQHPVSPTAPLAAAPLAAELAKPYDALLLASFGGPNKPEDVVPFLRNVVRGKNIPDARLEAVGEHYYGFGGRSPINEQNLALRHALETELRSRGVTLPVIWGNRNWHPYSVDVLRDASAFGAKRVLAIVTSAYASYSGSRQYREDLAAASAALSESGFDPLDIDIVRPFFNAPGFVEANIAAVHEAVTSLDSTDPVHVIYVTHSIPNTMQDASAVTGPGYREQHEDVQCVIDAALHERHGIEVRSSLAYCSRSGDPRTPWLEPDINDHLQQLAADGVTRVVIAPIGFISDHMEVIYDLDTEALETASELGIVAVRADTAGIRPEFVAGLVDLVLERAARERGDTIHPQTTGALGAFADTAPPDSCRMRLGEVTGIPVIGGTAD